LSKDDQPGGTAFAAAQAAHWNRPILGKTGTTQNNRSAGFVGATPQYAGAVLVWPDGSHPAPICDTDPPRLCGEGNIFGGKVPARTWFDAMGPLHDGLPVMPLPPTEPRFMTGAGPNVPNVIGQGENTARLTLERSGFRVKRVVSASGQPAGLVAAESPTTAQPGDEITITVSDGSGGPRGAQYSPPSAEYSPAPAPPYRSPHRHGRHNDGGPGGPDNGPPDNGPPGNGPPDRFGG
jgi:membrane peptidoglycan carboxypeptidase